MSIHEVFDRIAQIRNHAPDFERAHAMEDKLFRDVLGAIAKGHDQAQELAAAALLSTAIDFPRVTA